MLLLSECLALATLWLGSATPLCAQAVVVSGQSNLNSSTTFTGTPSTSTSITFSNQTYNPASFTVNSPANFGSLNDLSPTALNITNSGTTASTLTLSGGTNSVPGTAPVPFSIYGNSSFPSTVAPNGDLLFVGAGSSLTIQNGTGAATLGLNLASAGNIDVAATGTGSSPVNGSLNISASISGTNGLTKTGAGTLTLSGANTFTGGVNINQGQITLDFSAASAPANNIINSANALTLGNTFTSPSGVGQIYQTFPTLYALASSTASNTQTFSGLTLNAGANEIIARGNGSNSATIAIAGNITENAGGAVNFSSDTNGGTGVGKFTTTSANDASGIIGGFAVINATATNASTNQPNQRPTDFATVNAQGNIVAYTGYTVGTLNGLTNSQLIGTNPLTLANNSNYKVDFSSDFNLTGTATAGSTTITGNTTGLVVGTGISGPGITTGVTVTAIGTGSFTISSAASSTTTGTFQVAPNTTAAGLVTTDINTFDNSDLNVRVLTIGGGGTLRLGTNGGILNTNQSLTISGGSLTAGGPTVNTAGQINLDLNQATFINSNIVNNGTGAVALVLNTYGYPGGRTALTLTGTNTYSGGTYINSGRVQTSNGNQLGTGAVYIAPQGQLYATGGTYTNNFFISGQPNGGINQQLGFDTSSALRITLSTLSGTITLLGDAGIVGNSGTISGQVTGNYNLTFGRPLGGDGGANNVTTLANTSTGTPNNYGGNTIISDGTLQLGASNQIPDGAAAGNLLVTGIRANTTFNLNGFSDTVNGLSDTLTQTTTFTRTVTNNSNTASTLSIGANNATATYNGSFTDNVGAGGTLSLAKIGSGTETFGGVDAASGSLTVSGGTLSLASTATVTKTTSIAVNTGGTLLFGATSQVASTPTVALAGGTISLAGLSGAKETFGALTLTGASTIDFGSSTGNTLVFSSLSLAAGATLNVLDWTGSIYSGLSNDPNTDPTQDRLLFSSLASGTTQAQLANINFFSDTGAFIGTGAQVSFSGTPGLEVVPVPESSTLFVGLGLLGLVLGNQNRRRLRELLQAARWSDGLPFTP